MNVYFFHIKEKFYTDARPEGYFYEEYNKMVYAENLVDAVAEASNDDTVVTFVTSSPAPEKTTYSLPPAMVSKVYPSDEEVPE
jgi:hypothetical protein